MRRGLIAGVVRPLLREARGHHGQVNTQNPGSGPFCRSTLCPIVGSTCRERSFGKFLRLLRTIGPPDSPLSFRWTGQSLPEERNARPNPGVRRDQLFARSASTAGSVLPCALRCCKRAASTVCVMLRIARYPFSHRRTLGFDQRPRRANGGRERNGSGRRNPFVISFTALELASRRGRRRPCA